MDGLISPDFLVLTAGGTFVLAYLVINQIALRLIVMIGTAFYIWYYAVVADAPLWAAIWTSVAMGTANLIGLVALVGRQTKYAIPKPYLDIYDSNPLFSRLNPGDFGSITKHMKRRTLEENETVLVEGKSTNRFYYVLSGDISVRKLGQNFDIPPDTFVGEVAYKLDRPASATVVLKAGCDVLEWDAILERQRSAKNNRIHLAMDAMMSRDLANKIVYAVAPERI